MNIQKQQLLTQFLLSDPDLFTRCNAILEPTYFDPEVRKSIEFIKKYYIDFKALPTSDQLIVETGLKLDPKPLTKAEAEYALKEVELYCRNKAMEKAILSGPALMDEGNYDKILSNLKEAIAVSINRDVGLDYFLDPEERIMRMMQRNALIPLGYKDLDKALQGGVGRKELLQLMAGSGVGKSIFMSNLAVNLLFQKLNVCYITLELAEDVVAKRFDSMITGIGQQDIFGKVTKVSVDLERLKSKMGKLFIKRMPESTTNANHIRSYLKEFEMLHGFLPDILVIDYLDLMTSNQKISAENLFIKDKYVAEEVRSIAHDHDMLVISASQIGRSGIGAEEVGQEHIAGGVSKIYTCDNLIAIIQTEQMKAAGEYMLKLTKTRNSGGVGKIMMLKWDPISLRVRDLDDNGQQYAVMNDEPIKESKKRDIMDLMNA